MATSQRNFIDLVDDSDDEADKQSHDVDAIDLCSDSDEEDGKPRASPMIQTATASARDTNKTTETFPESTSIVKKRRVTYPISAVKDKPVDPRVEHLCISLLDDSDDNDDDSDDDCSILHEYIGLSRKRTSHSPTVSSSSSSRPSVLEPIANPYASAKPKLPSQPPPTRSTSRPFPYPAQLTAHAKQYSDERVRLLLSFWKYGRKMTRRAYERPKLDTVATRVVKLALSEFPIRSLEEYVCASSTHMSVADVSHRIEIIRRELEDGGFSMWSIAEANQALPSFILYQKHVSLRCLRMWKSIRLETGTIGYHFRS